MKFSIDSAPRSELTPYVWLRFEHILYLVAHRRSYLVKVYRLLELSMKPLYLLNRYLRLIETGIWLLVRSKDYLCKILGKYVVGTLQISKEVCQGL